MTARDLELTWVPFSKRRYRQWAFEDDASVFNAFVAFNGSQEVGFVYCLGGDLSGNAYGSVFAHRVGSCKDIEAAKKCVEYHFNQMMSGKPSDLWGM